MMACFYGNFKCLRLKNIKNPIRINLKLYELISFEKISFFHKIIHKSFFDSFDEKFQRILSNFSGICRILYDKGLILCVFVQQSIMHSIYYSFTFFILRKSTKNQTSLIFFLFIVDEHAFS